MILDDFITQDELENLPDDSVLAFFEFVRHSQRRLNSYTANDNQISWEFIQDAQYTFMNIVIAAAKRYEIRQLSKLELPKVDGFHRDHYRQFKADLDHYTTQVSLLNSSRRRKESVLIDEKSKNRIRTHIHALRECIDSAELTDEKRSALIKKLAEFEALLDKQRLNIMHLALVTLEILALPGGVWSSAEVAHKLVNNILITVAEAKSTEDEAKQLPPVTIPAALSPPRRQEANHLPEIDDEIPF